MTPEGFGSWVVDLLGGDLQNVLVSLLSLTILLALIYLVRATRLREAYANYEKQFAILAKYAPDVFIRIAFPDVDDIVLAKELARYSEVALAREATGLSWIDPRLLYAIDKLEDYIPEGYRIDFNVVLDTMELIYQSMKEDGRFYGRTDLDLVQLE